MAMIFGTPAILGVYLTRRYIFPGVPDPVLRLESFVVRKDVMVMLVFAAFMLVAALAMIRNRGEEAASESALRAIKMNYPLLISAGFAVGLLTGFVGAGGGFMILPVLVLLGGLPMKIAIGTDLLIIAAKSLVGFIGEAQVAEHIDYGFVALITVLPLAGIALGTYLNKHVAAAKLKTAFGYFVLVMGIYIVTKELFLS